MKEILKNVVIMVLFCVAAGLGLGAVYAITAPLIEKNNEARLQASLAEVLEAESFEAIDLDEDAIINALTDAGIEKESAKINTVYKATDASGNTVGFDFDVSEMEGYGGEINFIVGIDTDGAITGVSILKINETAGLGMKAKEADFRDQYVGKAVESFVVTKTGKTADNEIDAISAATITSKAMTKGVNAAIVAFNVVGGGVNE
ncbi:MAG: RnfABCDGE type electron transport complex subunit G [Lachnospiraceae bacterium]|nr:RnfABCDGE type electron transport complex subunit G [Lachnospiraceae bacterium]